ncbi:MAG: tetratricopeptide repeat protein [Roseburia sp.]|nr:tetratricopeptide repeat protein [Roseburia sp.]
MDNEEEQRSNIIVQKLLSFFIYGIIIVVILFLVYTNIKKFYYSNNFSKATEYIELQDYDNALEILKRLDESYEREELDDLIEECNMNILYIKANDYMSNKKYDKAISIFEELDEFKDSVDLMNECIYQYGISLFDQGLYTRARNMFTRLIDYKESNLYFAKSAMYAEIESKEIVYKAAEELFELENYEEAIIYYERLGEYKNSKDKYNKCKIYIGETVE